MTQPAAKPLPLTFHLSIVDNPERGSRWKAVIITAMRGSTVTSRKVMESFENRQEAIDELARLAYRLFYFDEGPDLLNLTP